MDSTSNNDGLNDKWLDTLHVSIYIPVWFESDLQNLAEAVWHQ